MVTTAIIILLTIKTRVAQGSRSSLGNRKLKTSDTVFKQSILVEYPNTNVSDPKACRACCTVCAGLTTRVARNFLDKLISENLEYADLI